jgi:hypothetical protein
MKRALALSSLLVGLCAAAAPALAQGPAPADAASADEASAMFERGIEFFHEGDYEAAMIHFRKAYELEPNWRVLYNVAQTSKELRDYAGALASYRRYLEEGGAEIGAQRRAEVDASIEALADRVATVTIAANVEGADVSIDDVFVGKTPLNEPLVVNAGRRKLSVQRAGYAPLTRYEDLAGTERRTIEVELVPLSLGPQETPETGAPASVAPPVEGSPPPSESSAVPWVLLAATAGAGVATGVFGGLALSKNSELDEALDTFPSSEGAIDDARSDARTFAALTDVFGVLTIVGAGATVAAFVVTSSDDAASSGAPPAVRVSVGPGSVRLSGQY